MFARPIHYQNRFFRYLITLHPQKYVNLILVLIGLSADLIALGTFFGAIHTPETGSNFYVNSREFLVWVLIAIVYSIGFINGMIRRRWRKLYGDTRADHSVLNFFAKMERTFLFNDEKEKATIQFSVIFSGTFLFFTLQGLAQDKQQITPQDYTNQEVEMADRLRAEGKIYVVVSVIGILLLGILIYTITIDRKLSRVEKELEMDKKR